MTEDDWMKQLLKGPGREPSPYTAAVPRVRAQDVSPAAILGETGMASSVSRAIRERRRRLMNY